MVINKIIFTGDPFRIIGGFATQLNNVKWLHGVLGNLIQSITGLPCVMKFPVIDEGASEIFLSHDHQFDLQDWAKIFWCKAPRSLSDSVVRSCEGAVVVAIELPPILQDAINQANIPWIDVGISPLRFLEDFALHVRTSHHFKLAEAANFALTEGEIQSAVRHVTAWYAPPPINQPTAVFFAQTSQDRTLIKGGVFCGVNDAIRLVDEQRMGRRLLVKPHPWESENEVVQSLTSIGGVITKYNTYALLASPMVEVLTLSSSVGLEARSFGRHFHIANPNVQDWAYSGVDVMRSALSLDFWGPIFRSLGLNISTGFVSRWRPNLLREIIGSQGLDMSVWG